MLGKERKAAAKMFVLEPVKSGKKQKSSKQKQGKKSTSEKSGNKETTSKTFVKVKPTVLEVVNCIKVWVFKIIYLKS